MRRFSGSTVIFVLSLSRFALVGQAQTSLTGSNLAYNSQGTQSPTLTETGYLGTYLTIPAGGATVNFDVNATGSAGHLDLVVANSSFDFNVTGGSASNYDSQNVTLPAGTYFVRASRDYDNGANQNFTINNLSVNTVSGSTATFANDAAYTSAAATDALNAANTYIDNYREGAMNLTVQGVAPGTPIEVKEINSAFKWGTNVPDPLTTYLAPGSTYSTLLKQNFNSITPENAGKWDESDTTAQLDNLDTLLSFASENNIRVRMHNLVWGSQQPTRINTDFTNAQSGTPSVAAAAKALIQSEITNRIANYVSGDDSITGAPRATEYSELDVYNESYNTGANASASTGDNYWKVMGGGTAAGGASWTAALYNQVNTAATGVGANTELFTNDYNILNNNSDQYGQFYSQHVESIRTAGGAVGGIGTEWYNTPGVGTDGSEVDPARAFATFQNLSCQGLPLEVTEFGVGNNTGTAGTPSSATAQALTTAMTLAFGTQNMTGFTLWGFYNDGDLYPGSNMSYLYNSDYTLNVNGTAYQALLNSWTTDDTTTVGANGVVTLPGSAFYGEYEAIINGQDYDFSFDPSTNSYVVNVPEHATLGAVAIGWALIFSRRVRRMRNDVAR